MFVENTIVRIFESFESPPERVRCNTIRSAFAVLRCDSRSYGLLPREQREQRSRAKNEAHANKSEAEEKAWRDTLSQACKTVYSNRSKAEKEAFGNNNKTGSCQQERGGQEGQE